MKGEIAPKKSRRQPLIQVVGLRQLQNELMCRFLRSRTGLETTICEKITLAPLPDNKMDLPPLVLWDFAEESTQSALWSELGGYCDKKLDARLALFNVNPDSGVEDEALRRGIRGLFYLGDSLATFTKGIRAILKGELWFSRQAMTKRLLETREMAPELAAASPVRLTVRERDILSMVASGAANDEIANRMCISPHTVRTHIYNIYRKIKVPNRIQATHWAIENLLSATHEGNERPSSEPIPSPSDKLA